MSRDMKGDDPAILKLRASIEQALKTAALEGVPFLAAIDLLKDILDIAERIERMFPTDRSKEN
jgi:hypothetical protein